ncbi:hypothetical protein KEGY108214_08420 [Kerstersia gyiorum]
MMRRTGVHGSVEVNALRYCVFCWIVMPMLIPQARLRHEKPGSPSMAILSGNTCLEWRWCCLRMFWIKRSECRPNDCSVCLHMRFAASRMPSHGYDL